MDYDKFLIAPLNSGLQKNLRPWIIPDDAFERLNNAYVFRGRVRKRFGSTPMDTTKTDNIQQLYSRLRYKTGTTTGAGTATGNAGGYIFKVGQMFSIGTEMFTVQALGTPVTMLTTGSSTVHTFNTTTGAYVFNGAAPSTDIYFYPAEPVMGIANYEVEGSLNQESLYAFDTQFAYKYTSGSGWTHIGAKIWRGTDSDFFWAVNHRGTAASSDILYVSNYVATDGLQYWDGSTWTTWAPATAAGANNIITAKIIIPFKDRLLLLNVKENVGGVATNFPGRVWYSVAGNNLDVDAYRIDIIGNGGFLDAPIKEDIVGAQLIRDRLIVFFERSTWELVYTGDNYVTFVWQQINIELGVESTFSVVPFDKHILGIGQTGVHACNGANVERIDAKIPDEVFDFHKNTTTTSVLRVQGIRDYKNELVYWCVPSNVNPNTTGYPSDVLVYNYENGSWALNDDSITALGYGQPVHEQIIAGNQEGFTFIIDTSVSRNAPALQISNITEAAGVVTLTIVDHNLSTGDYIAIEYALGITELNDNIYQITRVDDDSVTLVNPPAVTGTYIGRGVATRVSQIDILTKQFNFYNTTGVRVYLAKTDFLVNITTNGQILADALPSSSTLSTVDDGTTSGSILGTNVLDTSSFDAIEALQTRAWHAVYFQSQGENVQLRLYLDDTMMTTSTIAWSYFEFHAMLIHALKAQEL